MVATPGMGSEIRIRGISSVNGENKPLFIVNGIPMDELPANLDTSGLSINILKGSTALSLYGARAANGVILITQMILIQKQ
jgi:TonB-dependent SusC/RagA subfamily outer membrane receptor